LINATSGTRALLLLRVRLGALRGRPDQAWNDYKDGYTDIDGNVREPLIDEPEGC
jgi:hypothetical protein